ncbi:PD-(D/E)XK motif protein [Rossellomorea marisflavi]|uniref:PD-(D/E)XK motif protein n=1 Tax=Rossellomorea marisflavi TaxID=189381 RepID=UPI0021CCBADB|nr:PD-(D/E)XK motif protein [Rossellomorea marisflavi]
MQILNTNDNPWISLDPLKMRRVNEEINENYNAFWIADVLGQYGLMIQFDKNISPSPKTIKLNGVQIKIDNSSNPNKLILLLNDLQEWEIFFVLCKDLINVMRVKSDEVILQILKRLERWQKLLQKKTTRSLSREEQMGMFGELKILQKRIIPNYGCPTGIHSWVGALGDKQDFLLEKLAIEVKSYRVSSSKTIWISSKEQLNSDKNPLYLFSCALIEGINGETIDDLVEDILNKLEETNLRKEFIKKVEQYGYISEIHKDSLYKFAMEKVIVYEVKEGFPKFNLDQFSPWIRDVKYSIDLTGCSEFQVNEKEIFNSLELS